MDQFFLATRQLSAPENSGIEEQVSALYEGIRDETRNLISSVLALEQQVVPLSISGNELKVAVAADSLEKRQILSFCTGKQIRTITMPPVVIEQLIYRLYSAGDETLRTLLPPLPPDSKEPINESVLMASSPGRFLSAVIEYGISRNATDIHLTPGRKGVSIRVRIRGQLLSHPDPVLSIVDYKKLLRQLRIASKLPFSGGSPVLSGAFEFHHLGRSFRIRMSSMQAPAGEAIVLRLPWQGQPPVLRKISIPDVTRNLLIKYVHHPRKMLLISGPTGSGKTTLLYSLLQALAEKNFHVVTIEDPVERLIAGVTQTECKEQEIAAFSVAALRHDPDVLVPGEIRNRESAKIAVEASLSGHGVITTIHSGGTLEAISRLRSLEIPESLLYPSLSAIVQLQLLPVLCRGCKVMHQTASRFCGTTVYQRAGCNRCQYTGYSGQQLISSHIDYSFDNETSDKREGKSFSGKAYLENLLRTGTIDVETFLLYK